MNQITVKNFSAIIGIPVETLLVEMKKAGLDHSTHGDVVSEHHRKVFLSYLVKKNCKGVDYTACPVCCEQVKKNNFKRHVKKAHRNDVLTIEQKERIAAIFKSINHPGEVSNEAGRRLKELRTIKKIGWTNKEIAHYLEKNPMPDSIGKFGKPQDKYRWGFYGKSSMDYDIWSKGDKEQ